MSTSFVFSRKFQIRKVLIGYKIVQICCSSDIGVLENKETLAIFHANIHRHMCATELILFTVLICIKLN